MKVVLDRRLCSGHARCMEMGPDVYGSDDLGYCVLKHAEVPAALEAQARLGAANCPEGALRVEVSPATAEEPSSRP